MPLQTSASEIANYKGNAAAALGSDPGAATIYGETDAARVNTLLDTITATNVAKNIRLYEQKIKDRDAIFEKLASKEMSVNQLLPGDRDQVRSKYLDPIRKLLLAHPDIKNDPEKYLEFQNLTTDFEERKTYGQHRFIMVTQMDADIAKELDPQKRKRMQAHRDKTVAQDMLEPVKPYQEMLDFNDKTFTAVAPVVTTDETLDAATNKLITTTYTHTPLKDFVIGTTKNYIDSPNKTLRDEMEAFKTSFDSSSNEEKAKRILQWNTRIAEANKLEGYEPKIEIAPGHFVDNPDYVWPIKSKTVKDPNGEDHIVVDEPTTRVLLAESILQNYKNSSTAVPKISTLASEIAKNAAATAKDIATAKILIPSQAYKNYQDIRTGRASEFKLMQEGYGVQNKNKSTTAGGDFITNSALHMMDGNAFKQYNIPRVEQTQKMVGAAATGLKGYLLKSNDFEGNSRSVLSDIEEKALSRRIPVLSPEGKPTNNYTIQTPKTIIFNDDDKRNPFFTTIYDEQTTVKDQYGMSVAGPSSRSYETIKPIKLIENIIKGVVGESSSGNENLEYEQTMQRVRERIGGNPQNVNSRILELLKKNDWKEFTTPTAELPNEPKVPKKKVNQKLKTETNSLFPDNTEGSVKANRKVITKKTTTF